MERSVVPAQQAALARRRALFGLLDADGWSWAFAKAFAWFVIIIVLLGYIPDRAYYFTVQRTVDLGVLAWSPVNLCPPENETLPCPAPAGASLPWKPAPQEVRLPAGRTGGAAAVLGTTYVYAGGSDGEAAVATTFVTRGVGEGNLDAWSAGPSLPEARTDAAGVVLGSTLYVIGGLDADGDPVTTVHSLTVGTDGTLGDWVEEEALELPAPRTGASAVALSDGLLLMGGSDGSAPVTDVWKVQLDARGEFGTWTPQSPLFEANVDGFAVHVGDVVFLAGGRSADGEVVRTVQQGLLGGPEATPEDPNAITTSWRVSEQTNLPEPRTALAGFTANGGIYLQGGSDGSAVRAETWWAIPDAEGVIAEWRRLPQLDLGEGLAGGAGVVGGSHAFVLGGTTESGPTGGIARANLAPQAPFLQLGLLGAVVPALRLEGEIGQQIGYLNAAGVGTVNFVLLIAIGWAFAHRERVRELIARRRRRA